jgi:hypothetical protein
MKTIIAALALSLFSFAAAAEQIDLTAGSSVVISGHVVTCQGPSAEEQAPKCSIRQNGSKYQLYSDDYVVNTFWSFEDALAAASKMKTAGLCR